MKELQCLLRSLVFMEFQDIFLFLNLLTYIARLTHFDCLYHKPFSIVLCLGNFLQYILIIPPHLISQIQIHSHFPIPQPHFLCYLITKSTLYCPDIFLSKGAVHCSVVGLLGAKPLKKLSLSPETVICP